MLENFQYFVETEDFLNLKKMNYLTYQKFKNKSFGKGYFKLRMRKKILKKPTIQYVNM